MGGADGMKTVKADKPPDMIMRCRALMNTPVSRNDPAALQAMKDHFRATAAQRAQLDAISSKKRNKALAVLSNDQKRTLDTMSRLPQTMKAMYEDLMAKMIKMQGEKMGDKMGDKPMARQMMDMMNEHGSVPGQTATGATVTPDHPGHK